MRKRTLDVFKEEVNKIAGEEFEVFSYDRYDDQGRLCHSVCERYFKIKASKFLNNPACPYCEKEKQEKEFEFALKEKYSDEYRLIDEFRKIDKKSRFLHVECGETLKIIPQDLLNGFECPVCEWRNSINKSIEIKYGDEYSVLGIITDINKRITVSHKKCRNRFSVKVSDLIEDMDCPYCLAFEKEKQEFISSVKEKFGEEYSLESEYHGKGRKIKVCHSACKGSFYVLPSTLLRMDDCPNCKSINEYKQRDLSKALKAIPQGFVLVKSLNDTDKIIVKHILCGKELFVDIEHINSNLECWFCKNEEEKSRFVKFIKDDLSNEYELVENFYGNLSEVLLKHNKCNREFRVTPSSFYQGDNCPFCLKEKGDIIQKSINELVKDEYSVLFFEPSYSGKDKLYMRIKHNVCGRSYMVSSEDFLKGKRCSFCTFNNYIMQLKLNGDIYSLVSEYWSSKNKVTILHERCKKTFEVSPKDFMKGKHCPNCKKQMV